MPLNVEASSVISSFWTAFKSAVTSKSLLMQYDDDGIVYSIFAFDGPSIAYVTIIWKGTVPDNVVNVGYSQATNDSDKSDFETNYKPTANKPIGLQISQNGTAIASNPVLIAGSDGTNARSIKTHTDGSILARLTDGTNTIGTLFNTLHADPNGDRRTIHNNATLTTSGSQVLTWVGYAEWYLIINLKNAPTGGSPTIQFKIEQLDPIDQTTVITDTRVFTGAVKTSAGTDVIEVPEFTSDTIKISWTITGSSPSWTGVNVTFCGHAAGNAVEGQAAVGTIADDPPIGVAGVDSDGYIRYLHLDNLGNLITVSPAFSSGSLSGIAFGDIALSAVVSNTAVNRTTYTEQTTNFTGSIVSSSASDTSAGTGARTVTVTYLDQTGAGPFTETVTLNGITAVNFSNTNHCFIESIKVATVGSTGSNVGTITLKTGAAGAGTTVGTITATDNRTFWAHHYIPTGKTNFLTSISVTINGGGAIFFIKASPIGVANAVEVQITDYVRESAQAPTFPRVWGTPIKTIGPTRIRAYVNTEAGTSLTYRAAFDYYDQ